MTDSELTPVDIDLDEFEAEFYGTKTEEPVSEPEVEEPEDAEVEENEEDDSLATEEDETEAEAEEEEESEDEPEPKPEPKKSRLQIRIDQLVEAERLANERAQTLEKRLAALEAEKEVKTEAPAKPTEGAAPQPTDVDDKGEPKYPLGEFDPDFIRDLTRFTIAEETKAAKEQQEKEAAAAQIEQMQAELTESWEKKVAEAEADLPDLRQNMVSLSNTFQNVDPGYGEYLAMTIMGLDSGPYIMDYLSQNIGEAQKIVASGPAAATLALGRLDVKLARIRESEEEKRNKPVSKAPPPPEARSRGSGGKFVVSPDTDNLDAFEKEFFK